MDVGGDYEGRRCRPLPTTLGRTLMRGPSLKGDGDDEASFTLLGSGRGGRKALPNPCHDGDPTAPNDHQNHPEEDEEDPPYDQTSLTTRCTFLHHFCPMSNEDICPREPRVRPGSVGLHC